jgi:hypothetical protein
MMMKNKARFFVKQLTLLISLTLVGLMGCTTPGSSSIAVKSVELDKTEIGGSSNDKATLTATITPSDAANQGVSWTSSDSSIATVDGSGVVTFIKVGVTTITVTTADGAKTATCKAYGREIVGHWTLNGTLDDSSGNGFNGTWLGTAGTHAPVYNSADKSVSFKYTENNSAAYPYPAGPLRDHGDSIDCESGGLQGKLRASDYVTVAFWLYWSSAKQLSAVDGTTEVTSPLDSSLNNALNIINKCEWTGKNMEGTENRGSGWQIRYWDTVSSDGPDKGLRLYIHHATCTATGGYYETVPILSSLDSYRDKWVHIAVSINNVDKTCDAFVDGVKQGSAQTFTGSFDPTPATAALATNPWYTTHFSIGAFSHPWGGYSVNGGMRQVYFIHGLSDQAYIKKLMEF